METVAKSIDKDSPIQKTELTTGIKDGADNIHSDHEPNEAAPITVDEDNLNKEAVDSAEAEIVSDETKLIATDEDVSDNVDHTEVLDDNLIRSLSTAEAGEIACDQQLISNKSLENHPYKDLLLSFEPTSEQLSTVHKIEPPKSLEETPFIDIDKMDHLQSLVNDLKNEKEIGVDVEWSDRGYEALVCLIQLSTRDKDYIIDTIALKDHMHLLKDIFVDPNIVKIFHDASNDLKWLQQDFELYVVNMFDTQRAMGALGYSQLGLDFALQRYKVVKDKSMQRADFRKRPLPPKYKDYARTDSHFLVNMYQVLKNKLIEVGSLVEVLNQCNNDCKVVHEKVADNPYITLRGKILKIQERQLIVLEKLNQWRHQIAKYADVNTGRVLSKESMKKLALELPVDEAVILQICNSPYVGVRLQEVIDILSEVNGLEAIGSKNGPHQKFNPRGGFANKRKAYQIDFGRADSGQGPSKRNNKFYGGDTSRGRGKTNNGQNDLFNLRNTLPNIPFRGNQNRRGFGR